MREEWLWICFKVGRITPQQLIGGDIGDVKSIWSSSCGILARMVFAITLNGSYCEATPESALCSNFETATMSPLKNGAVIAMREDGEYNKHSDFQLRLLQIGLEYVKDPPNRRPL